MCNYNNSDYNFDEVIPRWEHNSKKWTDWRCYGMEEVNRQILPMWIADMDFRCEPSILMELEKVIKWGAIGYDSQKDSFYEVFIDWQKRRNSWQVEKHQLIPVPGVVFGVANAIRAFTKEDDKILVQTPVYYPFFTIIEKNKRKIVENPLIFSGKRYEIDFEDFERKIKDCKMMILCSPHNPVGRVWSLEELKKMAKICIDNNVLIVSDEIHSDLILSGNKHIPIASISDNISKQTITVTAPSKTFNIAGLNQSIAIISDESIRNRYNESIDAGGVSKTSSFGIVGFEAAYKYGEKWLDQALEYIEDNIDYTIDYIEKNISRVGVYKPEGTFLLWLDLRGFGVECEELNEILIEKGKLLLDHGCKFGEESKGFYRLNVGVPKKILIDALERLNKVCESL